MVGICCAGLVCITQKGVEAAGGVACGESRLGSLGLQASSEAAVETAASAASRCSTSSASPSVACASGPCFGSLPGAAAEALSEAGGGRGGAGMGSSPGREGENAPLSRAWGSDHTRLTALPSSSSVAVMVAARRPCCTCTGADHACRDSLLLLHTVGYDQSQQFYRGRHSVLRSVSTKVAQHMKVLARTYAQHNCASAARGSSKSKHLLAPLGCCAGSTSRAHQLSQPAAFVAVRRRHEQRDA